MKQSPTLIEQQVYRDAAEMRMSLAVALTKIKHPALWSELVVLK